MGLLLDASTEQSNHGNATVLNSIVVGAVLAVVKPATITGSNRHFFRKSGTQFSRFFYNQSGVIEFGKQRATTSLTILANNTVVITTGVHWAAAAVFDLGGADGDQRLYLGHLEDGLAEVPGYTTQVVGSGAHDDSSGNLIVGNNAAGGAGFNGIYSRFVVWNGHQPSLAELNGALHGDLPDDVVLWTEYGLHPTDLAPDYSGHGNHGTVTGATIALHAPVTSLWDCETDEDVYGLGTHPTLEQPGPINWPPELDRTLRRRKNPLYLR